MLSNENLVPMQPLTGNELQTAWSESWRVISRYRDFFRACKDAIAEALDGSPASKSDRGDEFWQDYALRADAHLVVGLYFSDEHEKAPGYVRSGAPIVWMAAKVSVRASRRRTRNSTWTRRAAGTRGLPGGASDRTYGAR